jgi:hypothetical protein
MASNFDLGNFELNEEISLSDLMLMPTQNLIENKYSNSCVVRKKISERNKKP